MRMAIPYCKNHSTDFNHIVFKSFSPTITTFQDHRKKVKKRMSFKIWSSCSWTWSHACIQVCPCPNNPLNFLHQLKKIPNKKTESNFLSRVFFMLKTPAALFTKTLTLGICPSGKNWHVRQWDCSRPQLGCCCCCCWDPRIHITNWTSVQLGCCWGRHSKEHW